MKFRVLLSLGVIINNIMEIGYIYKVTNKVNQKIYIGQTTRTLKER